MAEKSISDQIIDDFMQKVSVSKILPNDQQKALKKTLKSDKVKKAYILIAIKEDHKNENP